MCEDLLDRPVEIDRDEPQELRVGHRGQAVEQLLELVGDRGGQQVLPQRQDLAQLDVGRPEQLQPAAQLDREGLFLELAVDWQTGDGR